MLPPSGRLQASAFETSHFRRDMKVAVMANAFITLSEILCQIMGGSRKKGGPGGAGGGLAGGLGR